jgi:hypothetical protein
MKELYIISLLFFLSLPVFGAGVTASFDGITTVDAAWEKFESESQKILDEYEKLLDNKEFRKLKELRADILEQKPDIKSTTTDEQKTVAERELTPEEQEQEISELRANATAMKDKEQSTENKLLGAVGIGATGIGGMQLASALAEQSADADALTDMTAYLETFKCTYGNNASVSGGTTNIETPGGNSLLSLYTEYVSLANDLKLRKNMLEMPAGIESEAILSSANGNLYNNDTTDKTSGAYASLARALSDPTGADAQKLAQQQTDTADKLKTGAIVAGVGAVGGLVGDLAINAKAPKERSDEINTKYTSLKTELKKDQEETDE